MGRNQKSRNPYTRGSRDQKKLDGFLAEKQLQRKETAKDGSCLFRAISEQVYSSQCYHHRVRLECVSYIRRHQDDFREFITIPFEEYLGQLAKELWGGEVELVALSNFYNQVIVLHICNEQNDSLNHQVFRPNGVEEVPLKELVNPIQLAYSDGNHYDSVYYSQYMHNMEFCQGIVYRLLFEGVFKVRINPVCKERLNFVDDQDLSLFKRAKSNHDQQAFADGPLTQLCSRYSFDSLRAMSYSMYYNAALKVHLNERYSIERQDRQIASSIQFQVGDECRVRLPGGNLKDGEIVALNVSNGCHTVLVYDVNEQWELPCKNISLKYSNSYNKKRNPVQSNPQNRAKFRQACSQSSTENRHGDHMRHHHSTSLQPPSTSLEAWPTPTHQNQPHPPKQNPRSTTGVVKQQVSLRQRQPQMRKFGDRKGGQEDGGQTMRGAMSPSPLTPSRKTQVSFSPTQTTSASNTATISTNITQAPSVTINNKPRNTRTSSKIPVQSIPSAPEVVSTTGNRSSLTTETSQPVLVKKVDGGPGGSLTSEDYSGSSSEDELLGKVEKDTLDSPNVLNNLLPRHGIPAGQGIQTLTETGKISSTDKEQPLNSPLIPPTPRIQPVALFNAQPTNAMTYVGNFHSDDERFPTTGHMGPQRTDCGRESPYLEPQIPRAQSSQPEEAWPDPSASTLLSAMELPGFPRDPSVVSMPAIPNLTTTAQLPLPFGQFSTPPFPLVQGNPLEAIYTGQSVAHGSSTNAIAPSLLVDRHGGSTNKVLLNPVGNQLYAFAGHTTTLNPHTNLQLVHRSLFGPPCKDESVVFQKPTSFLPYLESQSPVPKELMSHPSTAARVSVGNAVQQPYFVSPIQPTETVTSTQRMPRGNGLESLPLKSGGILAPASKRSTPKLLGVSMSTQTPAQPPLPKMIDKSTQVEPNAPGSEFLYITTYTQTNFPIPIKRDIGVNVAAPVSEATTQTSNPDIVSTKSQTTDKLVPLSELEPLSLKENSSTPDKIKFAVEYTIKCLEACCREEVDSVQGLLDELKSFNENELTTFFDRFNPAMHPLDLSQQDFLRSFGSPFQQLPLMFNPLGSGGMREGHQLQIIQQQQEYERGMCIRSARQEGHRHDHNRIELADGELQTPNEDKPANCEPDCHSPDQQPSATHGFPPNFSVPHHPFMMPRPPMVVVPPFLYPVHGFPIPQYPVMPPPHNMMNLNMSSLVSSKSSISQSASQPLPNQEHEEGEEVSEIATSVLAEVVVSHQQESDMIVDSVPMSVDPLAVETFPPSSLSCCEGDVASPWVEVSESVVKPDQNFFDEDTFPTETMSAPKDYFNQGRANVLPTPFRNVNANGTVRVNEKAYLEIEPADKEIEPADKKAYPFHGGSRANKKADSQLHGESDRQRLPCRRQQNDSINSRHQGQSKTHPQHSRRQIGQEREGRPTLKSHTPSSSQLLTDSQKSNKASESKTTLQDTSGSTPNDSSKASPSKTSYNLNRSSQSKGKGGGRRSVGGQTRQHQNQKRLSSSQSSSKGTPGNSSQSQNLGGRSFNRSQDETSRQASNHAERDVHDATRGVLSIESDTRSEVLPGFPCSAFQTRYFDGRFLPPDHPSTFSLEPGSDYSSPTLVQYLVDNGQSAAQLGQSSAQLGQSATQSRWKFKDIPHEDSIDGICVPVGVNGSILLDWELKGNCHFSNCTSSYIETVEDPFHTCLNSQTFWDSDIGDFMTLTVDESPPSIQATIPGNPVPSAVATTSPGCLVDKFVCNDNYLSSFDLYIAQDIGENRPGPEGIEELSGSEWVI